MDAVCFTGGILLLKFLNKFTNLSPPPPPDTPTPPLFKFVLTGGPCGGKTTALARLSSFLTERGFVVLTVPEAATLLFSNGVSPANFAITNFGFVLQKELMGLQISLEDGMSEIARAINKPAVLLCDRGAMDGSAYMDKIEWAALLDSRNISSVCDIREGRYNAVFHLVTAAIGAEKYYTLENNATRTETVPVAQELDKKTQRAWLGHSSHHVIDNSTNFEGKLQKLVNTAAKLVGLPTLTRLTTKFLVQEGLTLDEILSKIPEEIEYQVFDIEKVYLYENKGEKRKTVNSPMHGFSSKVKNQLIVDEYSFVRRRSFGNSTVYGRTTMRRTFDGQEIEIKRIITAREYKNALQTRDNSRHIVKQKRVAFLYQQQSFTLHSYMEPVSNLNILHCQTHGHEVEFPPWMVGVEGMIERQLEVDGNGNDDDGVDSTLYGAFQISMKKKDKRSMSEEFFSPIKSPKKGG